MNPRAARPKSFRWTWVLAASLACGGALIAPLRAGPPAPVPARDGLRFAGEFGLRVWFSGDSVHIGWLTTGQLEGALDVLAGDAVLHSTETPAGFAHAFSFPEPRQRDLTLRYGTRDRAAEWNETRIDLDTGRRRADPSIAAVDSLFVIGDVHGEFDTLTAVLKNAGLVDEALRWIPGDRHLVIAGDMVDRGADATRVLWFLYGLERQARESEGGVHVVLGNHEIMVMTGDLRYLAPKEVEIARFHGVDYAQLYQPRASLLGRWLTSRPGILRIGDVLIAHGGVSAHWLDTSLETFDDSLAAFTHDDAFSLWADTTATLPLDSAAFLRRTDMFWEESSVFWYRGYARSDTLGAELDAVLDHFDSALHVVGHTPGPDVRAAYDGRLILTNTAPFGRQLLRLVRADGAWRRTRIGSTGPPEPF